MYLSGACWTWLGCYSLWFLYLAISVYYNSGISYVVARTIRSLGDHHNCLHHPLGVCIRKLGRTYVLARWVLGLVGL
jgi:hypothetical protein